MGIGRYVHSVLAAVTAAGLLLAGEVYAGAAGQSGRGIPPAHLIHRWKK